MLNLDGITISYDPSDAEFLKQAYISSKNSPDTSTKTGGVLHFEGRWVAGFNHFKPGTENLPDRHERPQKYFYMMHAEEDTILKAGIERIKTQGATLFTPWNPCVPCAYDIISAKITQLVFHYEHMIRSPQDWEPELNEALEKLRSKNILMRAYKGKIGIEGFFRGETWQA